ncbi:hypothetical protein A5882_003774, partial [Enterococcus sp. 4E1_DIV0656]|uniref:BspA family leucine-rich repeat surface protein n=1 Tax=Enterococcus sp. 4E1_DIV0656 TaxID=1834180 RepID=UPI000B6E8626
MNKLLRCILVACMLGAQFPVMGNAQASESESSENTFVSEGTDQSLEETESESREELVAVPEGNRYAEASESTQDTIVSSEQSSKEDIEEETTMSSDPLIQDEDYLDDYDGTPNREATSIASGTFGTSAWYITEEGVLHIGAGRFGVSAINNGPWWSYRATITKITFDGLVVANANSSFLFQSLSATEIEGLENLDTSNVTNMEGMFLSAKINNLDLSSLNTSRVTNMSRMFGSMSELESIDVSGFDTRNVTLMNSMFMSTALTSLNLSNFDTSKVTRLQQMFDGSRNLSSLLGAENWDTSNVVDMGFLFRSTAFTNLDLTDWNVSRVSNMQQMFSGMTRLNSLDISSWNTSSLTTFSNIFASTTSLSEINLGENSLFSRNNANTGLPIINRSGFSGRWVGKNTKNVYSNSTQFMSAYDGSFPDTYVWEASAGDVIVRYVDREGNALITAITLSGFLGDSYESEYKEIPGWYVVETPDNASGAFTEDPQEVVYVYERSDAAPVTVKYQDSEGNQLAEPSILSGKVGLPYDSEPKEIPGWYVV